MEAISCPSSVVWCQHDKVYRNTDVCVYVCVCVLRGGGGVGL